MRLRTVAPLLAMALGMFIEPANAQLSNFQITLTNLTPTIGFDATDTINPPKAPMYRAKNDFSSQVFTQPVFATHDSSYTMWRAGQAASTATQSVAENGLTKQPGNFGNPTYLVGSLNSHLASNGGDGSVLSVREVANPNANPSNQWHNHNGDAPASFTPPFPIMNWVPSQTSVAFNIATDAAHPLLSGEFMLVRTNDGFSGLDSINLFNLPGGSETFDIYAYDAGTEVNTEAESDLVFWNSIPSGHTAENGVITLHPGIQGLNGGFLSAFAWNTALPVGRITVTAVPEPGSMCLFVAVGMSASILAHRKRRKFAQA